VKRAFVISLLRKIRAVGTCFLASESLRHLELIRLCELESVARLLPPTGRLLEIGAGTGWQSKTLAAKGYDVQAIDVSTSNLLAHRVWPVIDYDGVHIPFEDGTFDVVYSSNVLEHIPHVRAFQRELHRVLTPGGLAIHVVPSGSWRWWTNITHVLKCWTPPRAHGEHAGNALTEIRYFSRRYWQRLFESNGWVVATYQSNALFYTGHSAMDLRLSISSRRALSRVLGGSCHIFVLKPVRTSG